MICLVSLTSRPQKGLADYWEKGRALLTSLLRSLWCSAFFIWQSPGRNPLPNLGPRLWSIGCQKDYLRKRQSTLWCSAFFIWQSPGRNPLPKLGAKLESLIVWLGVRNGTTILHFRIRQSTSDFSLFWGVFGVLPFLFGLFATRHWSLINLLSDPYWCQRPYHAEYTSSRPITEVKQRRAQSVLGWVTAWEHWVLLAFFFSQLLFDVSWKWKINVEEACFCAFDSRDFSVRNCNFFKSQETLLWFDRKFVKCWIFITFS